MIKEQFDLKGKVALVIGGRGFLGRRFCAALDEFGAYVYAADLQEASLASKHDPTWVPVDGIIQRNVDVTDADSIKLLVDKIVEEKKKIDILVYAVNISPKDYYLPFTECSLEGWQTITKIELDGLFLVTREVGRVMETQGHGNMIFISSIYGIVGNDQRIYEGSNLAGLYGGHKEIPRKIYSHAAYPAVKGGVISLSRYLAAYWGEKGIRVNCITPGGIAHPGENEEFVKKYSHRTPLGRKAGMNEISGALIYLASDASSYVTGHNLVVDGGWTIW